MVATDGFTGSKAATNAELHHAVAVQAGPEALFGLGARRGRGDLGIYCRMIAAYGEPDKATDQR